jgi:hypothetical protein
MHVNKNMIVYLNLFFGRANCRMENNVLVKQTASEITVLIALDLRYMSAVQRTSVTKPMKA